MRTNPTEQTTLPGRASKLRATRRAVLIVCEGLKTEPIYFDMVISDLGLRVNVEVTALQSPNGNSPDQVVEGAKKLLKQRKKEARKSPVVVPYEQVWIVFDTEYPGHSHFPKSPSALLKAKDNKIRSAVSRPCFEVWFILHFRNNPPAAGRYADVERALNKILEDIGADFRYQKEGEDGVAALKKLYQLMKDKVESAIRNSTNLEGQVFTNAAESMPNGQGTRVHLVVDELRKMRPQNTCNPTSGDVVGRAQNKLSELDNSPIPKRRT